MDNVRRLRNSKGWSQEHLAEASGVGRATIQRIESGRVRPTAETALALAAVLDADAQAIREGAGIVAELSGAIEISLDRDLSQPELRRLPPAIQTTFTDFFRARGEAHAAEVALAQAADNHQAAIARATAASGECTRSLRWALGTPGADAEAQRSLHRLRARLEEQQREVPVRADALSSAVRRIAAAAGALTETGLRVSAVLAPYC